MIKKLFPVEPLTMDKETMMEVVQHYDKVIIHRNYKKAFKLFSFFPISIILLVMFLIEMPAIYKAIYLLPIVILCISIFRLIIKKNITLKLRSVISVLEMLILIVWMINIIQLVMYDKMHWSLDFTFITPYLLSGFVYYIGYIKQRKDFKEHMLEGSRAPKMPLSRAGLIGLLGSVITRRVLRLTSMEFVTLVIFGIIFGMTALFSRSLIAYLQYDNIQEAKKELGLKIDD